MNFTITYNDLKAIANFAASKDVRYYLNGVHITPEGLEATQGPIAAKILCETGIGENTIICIECVKTILKTCKKDKVLVCEDGIVNDNVLVKTVDGVFPNLSRVMMDPERASNEIAQFDCGLLGAFKSASIALGDKFGHYHVYHNGTNGAPVTIKDARFSGAIVPWRIDF